jgi:uncharacterized protein (TIGR02271 family)
MTRSEEELRVGKSSRERGQARLRKYVVTEQVEKTVPVQREEVRLEREPITDANVGDATDGPAISDEEHEVTLHEEEVVVEKRAVPKDRVRMDKQTVTEDQTVPRRSARSRSRPRATRPAASSSSSTRSRREAVVGRAGGPPHQPAVHDAASSAKRRSRLSSVVRPARSTAPRTTRRSNGRRSPLRGSSSTAMR